MSHTFGLPDDTTVEAAAFAYGVISVEELVELSRKVFLFYLQDLLQADSAECSP